MWWYVKFLQEATHLNCYISKLIKFRHLFLWHQNMGDVLKSLTCSPFWEGISWRRQGYGRKCCSQNPGSLPGTLGQRGGKENEIDWSWRRENRGKQVRRLALPHRKQEKNPNPSTLLWLSFFRSKWDLMSWNNICCCCEKSVVSICLINMPLNTCLSKISLISWVLFILLPSVCLEALGFRVTKLDLEWPNHYLMNKYSLSHPWKLVLCLLFHSQ